MGNAKGNGLVARRYVIAGVAGAVGLAVIIGLSVGLTVGKGKGWKQPNAPRRAFSYEYFTSCEDAQKMFQVEVMDTATSANMVTGTMATMSADNSFWYPTYPNDYCDYCNCSGGSVFDGPVMYAQVRTRRLCRCLHV